MARTTKQLSGGGKDKFLRGLIADAQLPAEAALQLADAMCGAIADIRVRRDAWEDKLYSSAIEHNPAATHTSPAEPLPDAKATLFDPFVFSALAILTKNGRAALTERLTTIGNVTDLKAFAKAQHLALDATLSEPNAIREAIVTATEARLLERRAAAS